MNSVITFEKGIFYQLDKGHAITSADVGPGPFSLGTEFKLNSMMQMYALMRGEDQVGFWFYSGFKVNNKGGVLVAYLESKRGKGKASRLMLRHEDVLVFEVENCGVMAISPVINPHMNEILQEQ